MALAACAGDNALINNNTNSNIETTTQNDDLSSDLTQGSNRDVNTSSADNNSNTSGTNSQDSNTRDSNLDNHGNGASSNNSTSEIWEFLYSRTDGDITLSIQIFLSPSTHPGKVEYVIWKKIDGGAFFNQYDRTDGVFGNDMNLSDYLFDMSIPGDLHVEGNWNITVTGGTTLVFTYTYYQPEVTETYTLTRVN